MGKEFKEIEIVQPEEGDYCEIKVISYFKGWYLPECKIWPWLMDDKEAPTSQVVAWKKEKPKEEIYEFLPSDDSF